MARRKKKRRRNRGWFKRGKDPRRRVGFTPEEAKKGYQAALEAVAHDVHKFAWLFRRVRGFYRAKRREHGQKEGGGRKSGPAADRDAGRDAG